MTFRTKLFVAFSSTVIAAVALVSGMVLVTARNAFERLDEQRTAALIAQFRREFTRRGDEVTRRVARMAESPAVERMAFDLGVPQADPSPYVNEAQALASTFALDFVEVVTGDGAIVSSAQWPARFGYKDEWVLRAGQDGAPGAYLKREELADATVLGIVAVRAAGKIFLAGGQRLDAAFLSSLSLPDGMRVMLHTEEAPQPEYQSLVQDVKQRRREVSRVMRSETVQAIPLTGRGDELLGVLLVAGTRRDLLAMEQLILRLGLGVGAAGVLAGLAIAWWATARVTRPVERLAAAAGEVAAGNWNTHVDAPSRDEIGKLAEAFNQMTRHLIEQRDRLVQAERVAAWRELARRLAHELKNPLFPLQITVENLRRAKEQHPQQFDEVFRESVETLLAELANLKTIVGRFSDFARMPPPQRQETDLNQVVRESLKLFQAQFAKANIVLEASLDPDLPRAQADPEQFSGALRNLILNAMDAMPDGGALAVRTVGSASSVRIEIADTGSGLTKEECERLFTPYYTTKQHGTGLGLAIVQSVVSDHGGTIAVESEVGKGTTFRIELSTNGLHPHS